MTMKLGDLLRLFRKGAEEFEDYMANEGYEPDDEMDVEDVVESFKSFVDDKVEEAAEAA